MPRIQVAALIALLAAGAAPAGGAPAPHDDDIVGLWSRIELAGPVVNGTLRITRGDGAWLATIASQGIVALVHGDSLQFALSGDRGAFRGAWRDQHRKLSGFWIQPPVDATGYTQSYATPVSFQGNDREGWSGFVDPLGETFTLFAKIWRDDAGLVAAFRNPEFNSRGGAPQFRVARDGDSLYFEARPDSTRPPIRIRGVLRSGRLSVYWPNLERVLELERLPIERAAGFFPRLPADTTYVYRRPPETGDGWSTARAADTGIDEAALARVVRELIGVDPAARRALFAHSMLVAHKGKLVLEEYFYGWRRDQPHDLRSAGKTFTSVMLGAVMLAGTPITPDTPILPYFEKRWTIANSDPRKAKITLGQLMTHSSGLALDDNDGNSPGNEDTMQQQHGQPDWARYTLDLPMAHDPGTRFAYASGGMNLAGATIAAATNSWIPELFERTVATPLGFGPWHWNLTPSGDGYLGGGARLCPRDLLKVGQVYLDGGKWNGKRIVSDDWTRESTRGRFPVTLQTTGLDSVAFANNYGGGGADAYAWHPHALESGGRTFQEYEANGNGGQMLIVIPELDLAVVFTAGNYGQGAFNRLRDQIVTQEIVPAVSRGLTDGAGHR
jgi:CubicO group peptidase (beta-lactamase class C family)